MQTPGELDLQMEHSLVDYIRRELDQRAGIISRQQKRWFHVHGGDNEVSVRRLPEIEVGISRYSRNQALASRYYPQNYQLEVGENNRLIILNKDANYTEVTSPDERHRVMVFFEGALNLSSTYDQDMTTARLHVEDFIQSTRALIAEGVFTGRSDSMEESLRIVCDALENGRMINGKRLSAQVAVGWLAHGQEGHAVGMLTPLQAWQYMYDRIGALGNSVYKSEYRNRLDRVFSTQHYSPVVRALWRDVFADQEGANQHSRFRLLGEFLSHLPENFVGDVAQEMQQAVHIQPGPTLPSEPLREIMTQRVSAFHASQAVMRTSQPSEDVFIHSNTVNPNAYAEIDVFVETMINALEPYQKDEHDDIQNLVQALILSSRVYQKNHNLPLHQRTCDILFTKYQQTLDREAGRPYTLFLAIVDFIRKAFNVLDVLYTKISDRTQTMADSYTPLARVFGRNHFFSKPKATPFAYAMDEFMASLKTLETMKPTPNHEPPAI